MKQFQNIQKIKLYLVPTRHVFSFKPSSVRYLVLCVYNDDSVAYVRLVHGVPMGKPYYKLSTDRDVFYWGAF